MGVLGWGGKGRGLHTKRERVHTPHVFFLIIKKKYADELN